VGDDRDVAELLAGLGDVDRALLSEQPGAEDRHRWCSPQWQELPGRLGDTSQRRRRPSRQAAIGGLDISSRQQLGDELAEDDGLAVGDEIGLAGPAAFRRQDQPLDDVVYVGRVGDVAAAADPRKFALFDRLDKLREQGRVAPAPDEPRAQDDRLEAVAARRAYRLLGLRLGRRVGRPRVGPQRGALVDVDEGLAGHQRRLGAAVDEAAHARVGAGRESVAGPLDVAALEVLPRPPLAEVRGQVKCHLGAGRSRRQRVAVPEIAADRLRLQLGNTLGGCLGTSQRPHRPSFSSQALDQPAADEPRSTRHECCSLHRLMYSLSM
jgi:hypothetical protein